jgi:hypothetical protein
MGKAGAYAAGGMAPVLLCANLQSGNRISAIRIGLVAAIPPQKAKNIVRP